MVFFTSNEANLILAGLMQPAHFPLLGARTLIDDSKPNNQLVVLHQSESCDNCVSPN